MATPRRHASPPPSAGETVPILSGEFAPMTIERYRLRVAAHRIAADSERMLGELTGEAHQPWRDAVGKSLLAARRLVDVIDHAGYARKKAGVRATFEALHAAIRAPRKEIVDAMNALLALIPADPIEQLLHQDARTVRDTALALFAERVESAARIPIPGKVPGAGNAAAARMLVVEDDPMLRRQLAKMLERFGHVVHQAANGRLGLEIAEREVPDLILTDLTMPEMTGHELLARLKSTESTRHIPVIVVSGEGDSESVVKCLEQGAEDHLAKPYEVLVLQARVRATLERKRMRDEEMAYLRRVAMLTAAAQAVERQEYESRMLGDVADQDDPLGRLARVLDRMIHGVRTREEQLEARVTQLRAEMKQMRAAEPVEPVSSDESPFAPGEVLAGRYQIARELGKGGMGMVYLARDRELSEDVAIKVVRRDIVSRDPMLLERLKSEIRLARKISHKNVVRTHDLGEWQGVYFLSMEFIRGTTVHELIRSRGHLSVDSTLAIGTQVADALAVAHGLGIMHRDIKPQNLLLDEAGTLKVMDFGLARPMQRTEGLTLGGYIVGTPGYMAPELMMGGTIDARADLFAVGVVLYECLTGAAPFPASSPMQLIAKMIEGPPPPVRYMQQSVPEALERVVERLLEREPEKRFQSARELAEALAQVS